MSEGKRYLAAGLLIFLIILLNPLYYELIGYNNVETPLSEGTEVNYAPKTQKPESKPEARTPEKTPLTNTSSTIKQTIAITTPLYSALLSNASGGSLESFSILEENEIGNLKYTGQIDQSGEYDENVAVQLIFKDDKNLNCRPCIYNANNTTYYNDNFLLQDIQVSSDVSLINAGSTINLSLGLNDTATVIYSLTNNKNTILKKTVFYGENYIIDHDYDVAGLQSAEIVWMGGISPVEKKEYDDNPNTLVYYSQSGDRDYTSALGENEKI